jgi:hypothetical protein
MGAFTTVENVKSLFRRIKIEADTGDEKTNTVVTIEEVDEFIDETEIAVKARLSTCYDITNIGTESTTIIGIAVKYLVADIIKNIMALTVNNNSDRKNQDMGPNWGKKAKEMLEKICPEQDCGSCKDKPVMPLPDTPLLSEPPTGASLFSSASNTAQFTKTGPNW